MYLNIVIVIRNQTIVESLTSFSLRLYYSVAKQRGTHFAHDFFQRSFKYSIYLILLGLLRSFISTNDNFGANS